VPYYWTTSDGDAVAWFEAVHNATKRVIMSFYNTPWENYDAPVAVLKEVAKLERVRVLKMYTDRAPMTFRWSQAVTEFKDDFAIIDNTLARFQLDAWRHRFHLSLGFGLAGEPARALRQARDR